MPLTATDLITLSRLLDEAMDLAPARADAWLAALSEEHAHLRPKLREMLTAHLANSNPGFMADGPKLAGGPADETVARADELVGPYRLIREIGRGGMGAVWLAERADGTLKRHVALKLPRLAWGAGLAERMARERDIGALLEHPNIARLYDAGVDAKGRPFLALEYIDGQPLDAWCEAQALSVRDRLRLFVQVAKAVAYAHGRLVVHRDLKPSNVLVTADGRTHLLDFGIAKLLETAPGEGQLTEEQGRVLTPHYASPEQIRGETITVASDVYSLGVLLYELLTGRYPYEPERKSLAAIEEAILNDEPPVASSRAQDKTTVKALRGEIDAILAKALKREPRQRYATADALAEDIERHLHGERVLAQPDSFAYRVNKALRRHRGAFAAGAAILAAVLGGAGVSLVQAKRAGDAAERARVVKEFVVDVFKVNERGSTGNKELRQLPAELLLERGAKLIEGKFPGQPQLQAELFGVVGGIFADMGANSLAIDYSTRQIEALIAIDAGDVDQAKATLLLAQALLAEGRLGDARVRAQRALTLAEPYPDLRPTALVLLARVVHKQGDTKEAQRLLDRADQDLTKVGKPTAAAALSTGMRADLLVSANHFDDAIPVYLAAIETALAAEGPLSPTAINLRLKLQWTFIVNDRGDESRVHRDAALAALRASGAAGEIRAAIWEAETYSQMFEMVPRQVSLQEASGALERNRSFLINRGPLVPASIKARIDLELGGVYRGWGNVALAEPLILKSAALLTAQAESLHDKWSLSYDGGLVALLAGRHDDAAKLLGQVIDLRARRGEGLHPWAAYDFMWAARNLSMQGKFDEAESLLSSAPAFGELKGGGSDSSGYAFVRPKALAAIKLERGDAHSALKLLPPETVDGPATLPFDDRLLRGEILCAVGRRADGLDRLEAGLKAQDGQVYEHHPALARARAVTGLCALSAGQTTRARVLAALARQAFTVQPNVSPYFKAPLRELEGRLQSALR